MQKMFREQQVAEMLNISVRTLRVWRWAGRGPRFRKFGAAVRYAMNDIQEYVDRAERESTSQESGVGLNEKR